MTIVNTYRIVTCNDDYTDRVSRAVPIAARQRPLAILIQEGKNTHYRKELPEQYHAAQFWTPKRKDFKARAGTAVLWDGRQARLHGKKSHRTLITHRGVLPRGVTLRPLWMPDEEEVWNLASFHCLPQRYKNGWTKQDRRLAQWVRNHRKLIKGGRRPLILGMDTNKLHPRVDIPRLADQLGMLEQHIGIDAVFISRDLEFVGKPRKLAKGSSDHHPIEVRVRRRQPYGRGGRGEPMIHDPGPTGRRRETGHRTGG